MFDANAAHIKEGELFFAEVHSLNESLYWKGVKKGSIVLCEHVEKEGYRFRDNVDTKIWTSIGATHFHHNAKEDGRGSWLVYSGRPNGKGFICEEWKKKALDFLGGEWIESKEIK